MIGPDGVKVPDQQAQTGIGTKKVSDLIGETFKLTVDGTTVTATGDVHNIAEAWEEFSTSDNTGHFAVIILPAILKGQKITLEGRVKGARTVQVDDSLMLVQRLENLTSAKKLTAKKDGELVMVVDFSGITEEE